MQLAAQLAGVVVNGERLDAVILVLLVVVAVVVAWTAATIYAVHRDIAPLVNSPLARTLSGAGT